MDKRVTSVLEVSVCIYINSEIVVCYSIVTYIVNIQYLYTVINGTLLYLYTVINGTLLYLYTVINAFWVHCYTCTLLSMHSRYIVNIQYLYAVINCFIGTLFTYKNNKCSLHVYIVHKHTATCTTSL